MSLPEQVRGSGSVEQYLRREKRLKNNNIAVLIAGALPILGAAWSTTAFATVEIPDYQDSLDRAVAGPDLIGGVNDDTFSVYVGDREWYDSNIFRLPNSSDVAAVVGPGASRQDHVNSPSAGLDGQWGSGRQVINIALNAQDNRFSDNTNLNNVSTSDKLDWNWGLGGVVVGQVGVQYLQAMAGFANANTYTRTIFKQTNYFAAARYQLGPLWSIYGGLLDSVFGLDEANSNGNGNNSRSKSVDMGVDYATSADDTIGLDYRYTDALYPNAVALNGAPSFDPDYREDRVRLLFKHLLSEKTTIDINGGYLRREYPSGEIGSFSGLIWRGSLGWQPTQKTQFIVATWRNLQAYLTDQTNYYRSTGASISPVWNATDKITVSLSISRENQSYIGSSSSALDQSARRDTVNGQVASLSYAPTRSLTFDFSFHHEQRDSNQPLRAYTDGLASADVKFVF